MRDSTVAWKTVSVCLQVIFCAIVPLVPDIRQLLQYCSEGARPTRHLDTPCTLLPFSCSRGGGCLQAEQVQERGGVHGSKRCILLAHHSVSEVEFELLQAASGARGGVTNTALPSRGCNQRQWRLSKIGHYRRLHVWLPVRGLPYTAHTLQECTYVQYIHRYIDTH